jgi:hypothetical protein
MTAGSDADAIGRQLRELTQAVVDARDIAAEQKKELIELIQALSEQVVSARKKPVIASLLRFHAFLYSPRIWARPTHQQSQPDRNW